jgi:hypothetical protein
MKEVWATRIPLKLRCFYDRCSMINYRLLNSVSTFIYYILINFTTSLISELNINHYSSVWAHNNLRPKSKVPHAEQNIATMHVRLCGLMVQQTKSM